MVQRMVPAAKIARADKISKSPSASPGERRPARRRLQAHGSRACNQKHRTEHPAHPNRGKRGPDIPPPPTVRKPPSPHRATSFCPHQPTCRPAPAPLLPAPATRFPHTGRHPRPAQPPKYRKISVRTKKFRRRTLHSLRFLLSLHPL